MRKSASLFLSFVLIISFAHAFTWGGCPTLNYQDNFDLQKYLGTWYEAARLKSIPFEQGKCVKAEYGRLDQTYISVYNQEQREGGNKSVLGKAYCNEYPAAQCFVSFRSYLPWGRYNVISTDYDNYSVVYTCSNFYLFSFQYAWVLSRSLNYNISNGDQLDTLAKLGVSEDEMLIHDDLSSCVWP